MNNNTEVSNITDISSDVLCSFNIKTTAATITKVSIYSVIAIISLLGNSLLVFVFIRMKAMRKTIDVFVINMAVSDLFIPFCLIPRLIVQEITGSGTFLVQGDLGSFLCKISSFLADVSVLVSINSLVMITVERFMAVVFPFTVHQMSSKLRYYAILIVWIIAIGVHAPYFYIYRLTKLGVCATNWEPAFNHKLTQFRYYAALFVVVVILPFTVITILYSVILWTLLFKKDEISLHRSGKARKNRNESRHLRVSSMAATVVIAFAVCWAPFNVCQFIYLFAPKIIPQCSLVYFVYSEAALVLVVAYYTVNPVICFIFVRRYRMGVRLVNLRSKVSLASKKRKQKETEL